MIRAERASNILSDSNIARNKEKGLKNKILTRIGIGSALLVGVFIGGLTLGPVFAQTNTTTAAQVGFDKAAGAALGKFQGATIREIEVRTQNGVDVYVVELKTADGSCATATIDASSGSITSTSTGNREGDNDSDDVALPAPKVTLDQAKSSALGKYPGATFVKSELESKSGSLIYQIELKTADGKHIEIIIDANTGAVVTSQVVPANFDRN